MPWSQDSSGFTTKRGGHVANPAQYEKLRSKGMSKQRAAAITNSVNKSFPAKGEVTKARKTDSRHAEGAAIAGTGAAVGSAGLVGGGVPGVRSNSRSIARIKSGTKPQRIKASARSLRGGIFGYRADAHQSYLRKLSNKNAWHNKPNDDLSHIDSFRRGYQTGKMGPEKEIIRHMKFARRGSNVALAGGAGIAAYGIHRLRQPDKIRKAQRDTDRYHGAMAGAGGATAVGATVGARHLERQGRKWSQRSADKIVEAHRQVPNLGTYTRVPGKNRRVPDVVPEHDYDAVRNNPWDRLHEDKKRVETAGKLRGEATQHRYFASVYGKSGRLVRSIRTPAVAAAAIGASGLALSRKKTKKGPVVRKSLVEIEKSDELWKALGEKGQRRRKNALLAGGGAAIVGGSTASVFGEEKVDEGKFYRSIIPGHKKPAEVGAKAAKLIRHGRALKYGGAAGLGLGAGVGAVGLMEHKRLKQGVHKAAPTPEMTFHGDLLQSEAEVSKATEADLIRTRTKGHNQKRNGQLMALGGGIGATGALIWGRRGGVKSIKTLAGLPKYHKEARNFGRMMGESKQVARRSASAATRKRAGKLPGLGTLGTVAGSAGLYSGGVYNSLSGNNKVVHSNTQLRSLRRKKVTS